MKKIIVSLLLIMVCLFTISCGEGNKVSVPDGMKLASSDNDRFYLFVPASWTVDVAHGGPYAYYSASDASNVSVNFYISEDVSSTTDTTNLTDTSVSGTETTKQTNPREKYIDAYWNTFVQSMNTTVSEFKVIDVTETTLDSIYAKQYIYSFNLDNAVYKCRMVVTYPAQDLIFCLTYTSLEVNYDKHSSEIDKVIAEFKFNL